MADDKVQIEANFDDILKEFAALERALKTSNKSFLDLRNATLEVESGGKAFITTVARINEGQQKLVSVFKLVNGQFVEQKKVIISSAEESEKAAERFARAEEKKKQAAERTTAALERENKKQLTQQEQAQKAEEDRQRQLQTQAKRTQEVQGFRKFVSAEVPTAPTTAKDDLLFNRAQQNIEQLLLKGKTSLPELERIYSDVSKGIVNIDNATQLKIAENFNRMLKTRSEAHDRQVAHYIATTEKQKKADERQTQAAILNTRRQEQEAQKLQDTEDQLAVVRQNLAKFGSPTAPKVVSLSTKELNAGLKETNTLAKSFEGTLFTVKRLLIFDIAGRAIASLSAGLRQSITNAQEFTQQIAEITTLVKDAELSFASAREEVVSLSRQFGDPASEVAVGAYDALSNQVADTADVFKFMEDSMKFSAATVSSTADGVDILSSAIKSYGLEAEDASRVAAILFKGIDLGRFKAEDLANSLGTVTVPARTLGVGLDEVTAALAVLTRAGISPSVAMTQLRNIFQKMIRPSEAMKELLQGLGYESGQAALQAEGLGGFLAILQEKTNGAAGEIGDLFLDIRAINPALNLAGEGLKQYNETLDEINSDGINAYGRAVEKVMTSSGKLMEIELNKVKLLFQETFGQQTVLAVVAIADSLGGLDKVVLNLAKAVGVATAAWAAYKIAAGVATLATGGIGAAVAIGVALSAAIGLAINSFLQLEETSGKVTKSLARDFNGLNAHNLQKQLDKSKNDYERFFKEIDQTARKSLAETQKRLNVFTDAFDDAFESTTKSAEKHLSTFAESIKKEIAETTELLKEIENSISEGEKRVANLAKELRQSGAKRTQQSASSSASASTESNIKAIEQAKKNAEETSTAREQVELDALEKLEQKKSEILSDSEDPKQTPRLKEVEKEILAQQERVNTSRQEAAEDQLIFEKKIEQQRLFASSQVASQIIKNTKAQVDQVKELMNQAFDGANFEEILDKAKATQDSGELIDSAKLKEDFAKAGEAFDSGVALGKEALDAVRQALPEVQKVIDSLPEGGEKAQAQSQYNSLLEMEKGLIDELTAKDQEAAENKKELQDVAKTDLSELNTKQTQLTQETERMKESWDQIQKNIAAGVASSEALVENFKNAAEAAGEIAQNMGGLPGAKEVSSQASSLPAAVDTVQGTLKESENQKEILEQYDKTVKLREEAQALSVKEQRAGLEMLNIQKTITKAIEEQQKRSIDGIANFEQAKEDRANPPLYQDAQTKSDQQAIEDAINLEKSLEKIPGIFEKINSASKDLRLEGIQELTEIVEDPNVAKALEAKGIRPEKALRDTEDGRDKNLETQEATNKATAEYNKELEKLQQMAPEVFPKITEGINGMNVAITKAATQGTSINSSFKELGVAASETIPAGLVDINDALIEINAGPMPELAEMWKAIAADSMTAAENMRKMADTPISSDGGPVEGNFRGGPIYKALGGSIFKPRGSDRVPAMLTAGEFVTSRLNTQRNLALLKAINRGEKNLSHYINPQISDTRANTTSAAPAGFNLEFGDININGSGATNSQLATNLIKEIKTRIRRGELRL